MRDPRAVALIRAYDSIKPDAVERETFNEEVYVEPMPTFGPGVHVAIIAAGFASTAIWYGLFNLAHAIYVAVTR